MRLSQHGWDVAECGWDLVERLERLLPMPMSHPASSDTVESEGRGRWRIKYYKKIKKKTSHHERWTKRPGVLYMFFWDSVKWKVDRCRDMYIPPNKAGNSKTSQKCPRHKPPKRLTFYVHISGILFNVSLGFSSCSRGKLANEQDKATHVVLQV
jgi:hypothetical protein